MRSHGGFEFGFGKGHISEVPEVSARLKTRTAVAKLDALLRKKGFITTFGTEVDATFPTKFPTGRGMSLMGKLVAGKWVRSYWLNVHASGLIEPEHETRREITRAYFTHAQESGIPRKQFGRQFGWDEGAHDPTKRGSWAAAEWKRIKELRRRG